MRRRKAASSTQFLDVFKKKTQKTKQKKKLSFKIAMSGRTGVGRRPGFTFWLTFFFSKLYATFFLQWIALTSRRDEKEDQMVYLMQEGQLFLLTFWKIRLWCR